MKLSDLLNQSLVFPPRVRLALDPLKSAAKRVMDRWPEVVPAVLEKDQEIIVREINSKLITGKWQGTSVAKVVQAARVLFTPKFRDRDEYQALQKFYFEEISKNPSGGFVSSMFSVYLGSYDPGSAHTIALSKTLLKEDMRLGARWQQLLLRAPSVIDPRNGYKVLGEMMAVMTSIWHELRELGFSAPHAPGIIDHAHLHYLKTVGRDFLLWSRVETLLLWLKPPNANARLSGAAESINSLLTPWLKIDCPDTFQAPLLERLVSIYGDPRVSNAPVWSGVHAACMDLLSRWLTKADMGFFIDVVTNTQRSHMWPPRRDFWLDLYRQGMIDSAWVAFCPAAEMYAKKNLIADNEIDTAKRFGRQVAKGSYADTSLLIMKIGRSVIVEGCHSYKTHIFDLNDPKAPPLFAHSYNADGIRVSSRRSMSHLSMPSWTSWVLLQIQGGSAPLPHTASRTAGHILPRVTTQERWRFARTRDTLHLFDGKYVHSFSGFPKHFPAKDYAVEKTDGATVLNFEVDASVTGTAQIHRASPQEIYVTISDGDLYPTFFLQLDEGSRWRYAPTEKFIAKLNGVAPPGNNAVPTVVNSDQNAPLAERAHTTEVIETPANEPLVNLLSRYQKPETLGGEGALASQDADRIASYVRLLLQSHGLKQAEPRNKLFQRLLKAGKIQDVRTLEDEKGRYYLILKCTNRVTLVDAGHYLNMRIDYNSPSFWDQLGSLKPEARTGFLSRWEYPLLVTIAPGNDLIERFTKALRDKFQVNWVSVEADSTFWS